MDDAPYDDLRAAREKGGTQGGPLAASQQGAASGSTCHSSIFRQTGDRDRRSGARPIILGGVLTVAEGGNLVRLQVKTDRVCDESWRVFQRGKITEFSAKSRHSLMVFLNAADRVILPRIRFVTLTYHLQMIEVRDSKEDIENYGKRLDRAFGGPVGLVWKLEPQKRGTPHFHCLAVLPASWRQDLDAERRISAIAWTEVTGGDAEQLWWHLKNENPDEASWQIPATWNGVSNYAAKYVGKSIDGAMPAGWESPGRFWGVKHKECWPIKLVEIPLPEGVTVKLKRWMRKWAASKTRGLYYFRGAKAALPYTWAEAKALRSATSPGTIRAVRPFISKQGGGTLFVPNEPVERLVALAWSEVEWENCGVAEPPWVAQGLTYRSMKWGSLASDILKVPRPERISILEYV